MGYIRHHSIIVTACDKKDIKAAHSMAVEIFGGLVSEIIKSKINNYLSFFVAPDGSKEGWNDSTQGDENRNQFITWLKKHDNEESDMFFSYAELYYGDDEGKSKVIIHN